MKMTMLRTVLTSAAVLAGFTLAAGSHAAEPPASEQAVKQYLAAWDARDVDGMLATLADDAVVVIPQQAPIKGKDKIRGLLAAFVKDFSQPGAKFGSSQLTADGPIAYLLWNGDTPSAKYSFGADTFLVRDGKIAYVTVAFVAQPKQQ
jgi:ketosteroid isomerase-like protein